jgi:hypothetical protein
MNSGERINSLSTIHFVEQWRRRNVAEEGEEEGEGKKQWRQEGCFGNFLQWFRCRFARDEKREERGTRMKI